MRCTALTAVFIHSRVIVDNVLATCSVQAKDILAGWGLQIDPKMIQWDGRRLPLEKIYFGKDTVLVGEDADWGRDVVRKQLISTVSTAVYMRSYVF